MSPSRNDNDGTHRRRPDSDIHRSSTPRPTPRPAVRRPPDYTDSSGLSRPRRPSSSANSRNSSPSRSSSASRNFQNEGSKQNIPPPESTKKRKKKKKKAGPIKIFFRIVFIMFLIVCFAIAGGAFGAYVGIIDSAPKLELIAIKPNVYTSIIYDTNGNEIDRLHGDENREYITLDKIPKNMQNAIVAIEDERFYTHNGIDIKGILRAIYSKLSGNRIEGASTITQQLIKNNVTKVTRNTIETKLQEQYLAIKYEKELTKQLGSKKAAKDYILELYLNTIALHHGYNGVQAASLGYFNKDASELDLAECAVMAAITNNPTLYSPRTNPDENKKRQKRILNNMLEQGYITQSEYNDAIVEDVYSKVSKNTQQIEDSGSNIHSYFVDSLFEQISQDLQDQYNMSTAQANNILYNSGLQITSTLDVNMQKIMDDAFLNDELFPKVKYGIDVTYTVSILDKTTSQQEHKEFRQFVTDKEAADKFVADKRAEIQESLLSTQEILSDKFNYFPQPQAAMVIMDYHNGEVKALTGGRGEKLVNRGLNRAVDSARQPGSVFKVLASFAPGIDLGTITPATVFDDIPLDLNGYKPKNWYSNPPYRGLSTVRDGIRDSMNIVAVKAMNHTGIDACYDYLLNFGFTTLQDDNHASTALGGLTNGVTQLEVTAAFGAIANNGEYLRPMLYKKVLNHNGDVLLENTMESKQVLKKTSAFLVTDMMKDVVTAGTGTNARFKNIKMPLAGKTGTTQKSRDLTFVGYTPYYVSGIWLGYDRYDDVVNNMSNLNQSSHLVLWRTIMEQIHEGLEPKDFEKPEGIVTATICRESGMLASKICSSDPRGGTVRTEFFAKGTQPTDYCNVHKQVTYDTSTNMVANEYCPKELVKSITGIVRPEAYTGSEGVGDKQYEIPAAVLNGAVCNVHTAEGTIDESTESTESTTDDPNNPDSESQTEQTTSSDKKDPLDKNDPLIDKPIPPPPLQEPTTSAPEPTSAETTVPPVEEPVISETRDLSLDDPVIIE